MPTKKIIVLANSYKKKPGGCVAGRELGDGNTIGDWLRPISNQPEGELLPRHMICSHRVATARGRTQRPQKNAPGIAPEAFSNEADGTRTRNHRIDSPVL